MASNKEKGKRGELAVRKLLFSEGYEEIFELQNSSGHGTDIVAFRNKDGSGGIKVVECKYNKSRLNKTQKRVGGKDHTLTHITGLLLHEGRKGDGHDGYHGYKLIKYTQDDPHHGSVADNAAIEEYVKHVSKAQGGLSNEQIDELLSICCAKEMEKRAEQMNRQSAIEHCVAKVKPDGQITFKPWEPSSPI